MEVRSGSALLEQLRWVTPRQLTAVQGAGEALSFQGRSNDPGAFRRVNVLELALSDFPIQR